LLLPLSPCGTAPLIGEPWAGAADFVLMDFRKPTHITQKASLKEISELRSHFNGLGKGPPKSDEEFDDCSYKIDKANYEIETLFYGHRAPLFLGVFIREQSLFFPEMASVSTLCITTLHLKRS
jgi:hypothetical protein